MDDVPDEALDEQEASQGRLIERQAEVLRRIEDVIAEALLDLREGRLPLAPQARSG